MLRRAAILIAVAGAVIAATPAHAATRSSVAALQVALQANGHYPGTIDGVDGPLTRTGLTSFQAKHGLGADGTVGKATRAALGALGRPLLGQRELIVGAIGWDVSSLEFSLVRFGLPLRQVDGKFTRRTARALARFQRQHGLTPDGIAGVKSFRALARGARVAAIAPRPAPKHVVKPGESFYSIATAHGISPLVLADANGVRLDFVLLPGQKLVLPIPVRSTRSADPSVEFASKDAVRASLDHWSGFYGVDPRLARAVAWMESGFQQHVVSHVGAVGVMQLLPDTWDWLDALIGIKTPRTYDGNVRAGVRYLRWLLDEFGGDRRLALAGYYQGARAVRDRGLFDDTKQYVATILQLYGSV